MTYMTRVNKTTNQSIADDGSWHAIAFDGEQVDDDNLHDTSTNNTRITANALGNYNVTASVEWASNGTGLREMRLVVGVGATIIACINEPAISTGGNHFMAISVAWEVTSSGAYIQLEVKQSSGGSLNIISSNNYSPRLAVIYNMDPIVARVSRNSSQSINNNLWTALGFNTEDFDTDSFHDNSTNNTRLTAQRDGYYRVNGNVTFASDSTGIRGLAIKLNGSTTKELIRENAVVGAAHALDTSSLIDMAKDDYVELEAYQNSGGSLNVQSNTDYSPIFSIEQVE